MKIFIFSKKTLLIFSLIIIFIFIYCVALHNYYFTKSQLVSNSNVSLDTFINNVRNLTNGDEKIAYLTFDDGPNVSITPKVLDILKEEDVKATFFVIGKYVDEHPEIVKRAYDEGHFIANHSYSHDNSILYRSSEDFINEIQKTDQAIGDALGIENYTSHLFRFPNGFMAPSYKSEKGKSLLLLSKMNYTYIDWNSLNNDSIKKYSSTQLFANLKDSIKNKKTLVILMHDTKDVSNSSLVLKDSIEYLKSLGYKFKNFYSCYNLF